MRMPKLKTVLAALLAAYLIALVLFLTGCANTTDEYLTGSRCVPGTEYQTMTVMPVMCGQGCITYVPMTSTSCQRESYTYKNTHYIPPEKRK